MYPTLGHFFSAVFGTEITFPLPTYGFLLATAFFSAFLVMRAELKRKWRSGLIPSTTEKVTLGQPASPGELFTYGFFGFLLGFKLLGVIVDYSLFAKDVQYYILSLEGSLFGGILGAAIFGYYIFRKRNIGKLAKPVEKTEEVPPHQQAAAILLIAAVSGIVGAKIFHQLENFREFLNDPVGSLFSAGGLTFYGGLIFGVIAVLWYIRKKNIPPAQMMDVAAPAVMLAYGIGRIGCMASGDGCWGIPNTLPKPEWMAFLPDWMWAYHFPHNVINSGIPIESCSGHYCYVLEVPVWPTPLYESTISIIFFAVLWVVRKRIPAPGVIFGIFMMMNGVERFFIEKIRVNNKYNISGFEFTQAEVISALLFLIGGFIVYWFIRKHRKEKSKIVENEILTEQTEL
jgi:phosphatidylglycerol---prolipoprotein diacylglyceryl transferase